MWFGVGFNAQTMSDKPYAIIVDGTGAVTERRLADHGPGTQLRTSINVTANTVSKGKRTVVLTRAAQGMSQQHTNFTMQQLQEPKPQSLP